ncbi:MAG: hypothetical protein HQM13_00565 [SAR324 cluster bacterium]|nr:hypothetical protein [SAR324 cluster bacterium]
MLSDEYLTSSNVIKMLRVLEKSIDDKIIENRKLRKELRIQEEQCLMQARRMIEMKLKIQSMEEFEVIDAGDVINLEWDEVETV